MKQIIIKLVLWFLNWIDNTPSKYGRIDNIRNYSREFLDHTRQDNPHLLLRVFLQDMDAMDRCMKSGKNCVVQNGKTRDMTDADIEELKQLKP